MRRAQHPRTAARHIDPTVPPVAPLGIVVAEPYDFVERSPSASDPVIDEILLSPAGTFASGDSIKPDARNERRRELAIAIRQRIESRLHGRVRNLAVRILGDTVVLEGQCSTYYTKQLAQHTALGVLEHEHLDNEIEVCVPRC
jgi:hypothetical protein